jgi:hypothetical protein
VAVAKATGAGLAVEEDDPARVLAALGELRDPSRWDELARGAWQAATGMFDPDRIHSVFVDSLNSVIERKPALQAATR